jgi:sortase A
MTQPPSDLSAQIGARAVRFPTAPAPGRRRPGRAWRWLSVLLILAGLALGGDVLATLLWQEPVTAVIATVRRADINQRWAHGVPLNRADQAELASIRGMDARLAFLAAREAHSAPEGAALGSLAIPAIGAHFEIVQGTTSSSLALGPGHYRETGLPGQGGTVAIAGHRTTYLAPFRNINELKAGDPIQVKMSYGTFTYVVQATQIVAPDDWGIIAPAGYERLVLSSCNPLFSAAQRIAVFARLASVTPRGAAVHPGVTDSTKS